MNKLEIGYGAPKSRKIAGGIIGAYLLVFSLYFTITGYMANQIDALFYASLIGAILAAVILLTNTVFSPKKWIEIDSETIDSRIPGQSKLSMEWVSVSRINIGVSYIVFFVNGGQKQQKLDLSSLKYTDVALVKSKIIELSGFKNISYTND